jgi:L-histidine Nalpha-methyltransferase
MQDPRQKFLEQLKKDVDEGLSAKNKYLQSKYFYDAAGDELFRRIMRLPDYYLTACETEILKFESEQILKTFNGGTPINIIELGSGDASKTRLLLEAAKKLHLPVNYYPVDISPEVLNLAKKNTADLAKVFPISADYNDVLGSKELIALTNKFVLYLGANIGNFSATLAFAFMQYINKSINTGDHVLIGFDLVKDPTLILSAYNDVLGLTSAFNLNLLTMLNRELEANFVIENFFHAPMYDEKINAAKSFLVSNKVQEVFVKMLNCSFSFKQGEAIFTEISSKYSLKTIEDMSDAAGFGVMSQHTDRRNYFVDVLLKKN